MQVATGISAQLYGIAWGGLLVILAFYITVGVCLRWRPQRIVRMTRYEPPEGISPAIAALLFDNGRSERSFAAAIVSLASKGYVKLLQAADWCTIEKLRDVDTQLYPEESTLLSSLFPAGTESYSFNESDSVELFRAYRDFRSTALDVATPELMSTHVVLWLVGVAYSLTVLEPIFFSAPKLGDGMSLASIGFMTILIIVGASCFVAALRVWPVTLAKLASLLRGNRDTRRRFNLNDMTPLLLTGPALLGYVSLAVLTSTKFASLVASVIAMNVFSRYLLNAPTSAGRKVIAELSAFRDFLSRTDEDRINRENKPGSTPRILEPLAPYAVALGVGRGWGKEFAGNILELVQFDQAYSLSAKLPMPDNRSAVLKLFGRKK